MRDVQRFFVGQRTAHADKTDTSKLGKYEKTEVDEKLPEEEKTDTPNTVSCEKQFFNLKFYFNTIKLISVVTNTSNILT